MMSRVFEEFEMELLGPPINDSVPLQQANEVVVGNVGKDSVR